MSLYYRQMMTCSVCGYESEQTMLNANNAISGVPDLDLRPPGMQRSTMCFWIHQCPQCGFVSNDLTNADGVDLDLVHSEEYKRCGGIAFLSDLAERFYKAYYIQLRQNKPMLAFHSILHCAWACDDIHDTENSVRCRERALALSEKLMETNAVDEKEMDSFLLIRADLLRRSCRFDALINEYSERKFERDFLKKVIAYQIELAKQGDTACYTMNDVE